MKINRYLLVIAVTCTTCLAEPIPKTATLDWSDLKRSPGNKVEPFHGHAWFCEAMTVTGSTTCHWGEKPPKPGCYVLLNERRTAWVAAQDAAKRLEAEYTNNGRYKEKEFDSDAYGCGYAGDGDYWLLYQIH